MAWFSASGVIILHLLILNAEAVIQCDPGQYGASGELPCPTHCTPLQGSNIKGCDRDTRRCYEGCVPGWYGDYCNRTCSTNCMNNTCNQGHAHCTLGCKEKYFGNFCNEVSNADGSVRCIYGHYGASCDQSCPPHCAPQRGRTIRECDRDTGECYEGCVAGWYGNLCNWACSKTCKNNICEQHNAHCTLGCEEKYIGDFCNKALPTCEGSNLKADSDLRVASMVGDLEKVNCILTEGQADINCKSWFMMTPVMLAAENGHRDVLQFLLSKGADASQVDGVRNNILHLACLGGHLETVKFVLSKKLSDINSRDRGGMTPVMEAAVYGNREVVKLLVSEGADLSLADREGNNILHVAAERGDVELLKFILSQHVVDINIRNTKGHTAADMARQVGHNELANLLVP